MQTFKHGVVAAALLFSPMMLVQDPNSQLTVWFSQRLAGFSDEVAATIRTSPNLLLNCEQPALSVSGSAELWDNVNVLIRYTNEKHYLQVNMQVMGNYVVVAASVARGSTLTPVSVALKRGRLDQLPPRAVLNMSRVQDIVSLRDLVPSQSIQLSMLCQAWQIEADQCVLVIANGDGFRINAKSKAPNDAAVAQNARVRMISGQVVSSVVDPDGNIFISLQQVKDLLACADK